MLITPESELLGSHLCKKGMYLCIQQYYQMHFIFQGTCVMIPTEPVNVIICTCGEKGNLVVSCQNVSTEKVAIYIHKNTDS